MWIVVVVFVSTPVVLVILLQPVVDVLGWFRRCWWLKSFRRESPLHCMCRAQYNDCIAQVNQHVNNMDLVSILTITVPRGSKKKTHFWTACWGGEEARIEGKVRMVVRITHL